jgi:hypothetical protein
MNKSGKIKRMFPKLHLTLNKIEMLMITFVIAISGVNMEMGYTNIADSIGKKIIFYIYLNESIERLELQKNDLKNNINKSNLIKENYKFQDFIKLINFNTIEYLKLGCFFLDILTFVPSDIFEKSFNQKEGLYKNEVAKLIINPIHFDEIKKNIIIDPATLPMICKPIK